MNPIAIAAAALAGFAAFKVWGGEKKDEKKERAEANPLSGQAIDLHKGFSYGVLMVTNPKLWQASNDAQLPTDEFVARTVRDVGFDILSMPTGFNKDKDGNMLFAFAVRRTEQEPRITQPPPPWLVSIQFATLPSI